MKLKQEVKLHNRWDVTVCDAETGEVKQKAVGFNVITDTFFKFRMGLISLDPYPTYGLNRVYVGTGTGTPSASDTAMFNLLFRREFSSTTYHYEYPTSYAIFEIKVNADEYNGQTFTEVGLAYYYVPNWGATSDHLCTHAILQDAEGNPIAIHKTDTDVVYIRATFYCTFTPTGWGDNGIYPEAAKNTLVQWLLKGTDSLYVRSHRFPLNYSSDMNADYIFSKQYRISNGQGHFETMTFDLPEITILDSEFNNHVVKNIGIEGYGAFQFPDSSVFSDYEVNRLFLGEGDGETTDFNIKCPCIKPGSAHIFVDDEELTEGTDFTVDYESNCNDNRENYYTAGMDLSMDTVKFGNLKEQTPSASTTTYDPLYYGRIHRGTNLYYYYPQITAAKPIWFDFGSAKECNRLRLDSRSSVTNADLNAVCIEYSNDNETWTAVSATWTNTLSATNIYCYRWKWDAVSARYWRIYWTGKTYNLRLDQTLADHDGISGINAILYLGRSVPGLHFTTPPAAGARIEASYLLNVPFKTENNLMRIACSVQLQRG